MLKKVKKLHQAVEKYLFLREIETPGDVTEEFVDTFLTDVKDIDISEAEKLRHLASSLEAFSLEIGWERIIWVYNKSISKDSKNPLVYHSIYVSGLNIISRSKKCNRELIVNQIINALDELSKLDFCSANISEADLNYFYASTYYHNLQYSVACQFLKECLKLNSNHNGGLMYFGHAYQDLNRWNEAIDKYYQINLPSISKEFGVGKPIKIKQCIAYCYLKLGKVEKSIQIAIEVLKDLLKLPPKVLFEDIDPYDFNYCFEIADSCVENKIVRKLLEQVKNRIKEYPCDSILND